MGIVQGKTVYTKNDLSPVSLGASFRGKNPPLRSIFSSPGRSPEELMHYPRRRRRRLRRRQRQRRRRRQRPHLR